MNKIQKSLCDLTSNSQKSSTKSTMPARKSFESPSRPKVMPKTTPILRPRPQTSAGMKSIIPQTLTIETEPWSSLLLTNRTSSEKVSIFNNFDPLRTLHFLTRELQIRVETILPDDTSLQQMVSDIQIALKRVPPEVSSLLHLKQMQEITKKGQIKDERHERPTRIRVETVDKFVQTPPLLTGEDTEKIKRFVEKNTLKLETTCKEMEQLCALYQKEKEGLEIELEKEKQVVKNLSVKLKEADIKIHEFVLLAQDLKSKNAHLEQISNTKMNDASLSEITKLKAQRAQLHEDLNSLKQKYTILEMEKERFATLLTLRDGEIAEYRNEIEQLQVNFLKLDGELASCLLDKENNAGDGTISSIMSHGDNTFRELQSGDGLVTSDVFQDSRQGEFGQRQEQQALE